MTNELRALVASGSSALLADIAARHGWTMLAPAPWSFHTGRRQAHLTPSGCEVQHVVSTRHAREILCLYGDGLDAVVALLSARVQLRQPESLDGAFARADTVAQKLALLLDVTALQAHTFGDAPLPCFAGAVRAALDDADALVRLAAIRALGNAPGAFGAEVLRGRTDRDNPGLGKWRDVFARVR